MYSLCFTTHNMCQTRLCAHCTRAPLNHVLYSIWWLTYQGSRKEQRKCHSHELHPDFGCRSNAEIGHYGSSNCHQPNPDPVEFTTHVGTTDFCTRTVAGWKIKQLIHFKFQGSHSDEHKECNDHFPEAHSKINFCSAAVDLILESDKNTRERPQFAIFVDEIFPPYDRHHHEGHWDGPNKVIGAIF